MVRSDDYLHELAESASQANMKITYGGRFHHLIGTDQDKGRAVKMTSQIFTENWGSTVLTIGIGNGHNDIPMLDAVDLPILIPYPEEIYEETDLPVVKARYPGSKGWNEALMRVIDIIEKTGY
jgi:mannosyl-3-phosphoglycerate phosphatase